MSAAELFGVGDDFAKYRVGLTFTDVVVGGVPSDPSVIRKWLTARLELGDAALEELITETIASRNEVLSVNDKVDALMESGEAVSVNGFKRNVDGIPCLEGRNIKAGLKEWVNVAYPGITWPKKPAGIKKGLMRYGAERIFVPEILVPLENGVVSTEERIKHVMTPQGPRSAINRVEVVRGASIQFTVSVLDDFLPVEAWARVWQVGEQIGLGADRARSDGKFSLDAWKQI